MPVRHERATDAAEPLNLTVGLRIAGLLRANRLTQADLGAELRLDRAAVSRRINGRISWKLDELALAAGLLGVPVADLMAEAAPAPEPKAS